MDELLLRRVLYGISCRNYESAAESVPGAIGLSSSSVSRGFVEASAAKLREMQERDLSGEDVVAMVVDGKTFADATMVLALGITLSGDKRFLGFVETDTENERVLRPFLLSLVERGLDISQGLLVVIDGSKGLRAAVTKAFRNRVVVARCQWHKRENVVSHLAKSEQTTWRRRLQRAYDRPTYKEALSAFGQLHSELEERNQSAAKSLEEGFEETLTLHRLGVFAVLGRSLKTTNCLESVNALVEERCAKIDHWKNSSQRSMACDRARRHRATTPEGDGLPPPSKATRSAQARAEDRDHDEECTEEESCLNNRAPWIVSTKNGLDSAPEHESLCIELNNAIVAHVLPAAADFNDAHKIRAHFAPKGVLGIHV